jgi:hypothetical protein
MGDTTDEPIVKQIKLRGAARAVMKNRSGEVLLAGPAGTGKSYAALLKVHLMCMANPGMRALMVRQTHISLTNTGLVTYRDHVAKDAIEQGIVTWFGGSAERPAQYTYSNGSVILVGGMDKPDKIMSMEIDVAYVQEATELTKDGWEKIGTRLRNGVVSFQQLIADCNPQQPTHWLKQRADEGVTTMLYSRHEDNPRLFGDDGVVTEYGASYIARLDALTGVRKERLRWGRWAAAEGLVYEGWDPATHILDLAACGLASTITKRLPFSWRRIWVVDFGYTNPFVWQQWAIDGDGRMYLEEEIYRTKGLVEDHAKAILARVTIKKVSEKGGVVWLYPKPHAVICDHDAEDRATLEKHLGMGTVAATKTVSDGIQAVQTRLRLAGDGKPRLYVLRDSRGVADPTLAESGKPTSFADEIEGYVWEPDKDGKPSKDTPLKLHDHAMDAGRYAVAYEDLKGRAGIRGWL